MTTSSTYGFSGSRVFVVVATGGQVNITAYGAHGGSSQLTMSTGFAGGKGAEEEGTFTLTTAEQLSIWA